MNPNVRELALERPRCKQWSPLLTQQLRLRHLHQVMAYNLQMVNGASFYFTLHLTTMSAPFYTSEKMESANPRWAHFEAPRFLQSASTAFVVRIWQSRDNDLDRTVVTWGVYLSGLIYLGVTLADIQPDTFKANTVIFRLRGGYFTSYAYVRDDSGKCLPFIDSLNVVSTETATRPYKCVWLNVAKGELRNSYTVAKLQQLQNRQFAIKNLSAQVDRLKTNIVEACGFCESTHGDVVEGERGAEPELRHNSHLLTMTALNRMLHKQDKPTKQQRLKIIGVKKQIEVARFRTRLLFDEKDRKVALIRQLKQKLANCVDENDELCKKNAVQDASQLMENFRKLNRESHSLREWGKDIGQLKEALIHTSHQLNHRRRQLMGELLFIYPIVEASAEKYQIHGIHLPDAHLLSNAPDNDLAVALGYICHILKMCSLFLQVPLRYPINYFGSMSYVTDHISATLLEKDRDFPLFTKGKDRMHFLYGVYLLNKNIAQLKWLCGQTTPDLRATLANLLTLLQSRHFTSRRDLTDSKINLDQHPNSQRATARRQLNKGSFTDRYLTSSALGVACEGRRESPSRRTRTEDKSREGNPGLSQILAIPEAYLNQQISSTTLKGFIPNVWLKRRDADASDNSQSSHGEGRRSEGVEAPVADNVEAIEEGTDAVATTTTLSQDANVMARRKSQSADALLECAQPLRAEVDARAVVTNGREECVQQWLANDHSEESLYGETTATCEQKPLTARTDALLHTTSFNLVKPK